MFWEPSKSSSLPTVVFHKAHAGTNQTLARYEFVGKMDDQAKTRLEIDPKFANILLEMDPNRRNLSWFPPKKNPKKNGWKNPPHFFCWISINPNILGPNLVWEFKPPKPWNSRDVKFGFQMETSWDIGLPLRVALPDGGPWWSGVKFPCWIHKSKLHTLISFKTSWIYPPPRMLVDIKVL